MRKKELRKIICNLRINSRKPLKNITNGRLDKHAKKAIATKRGGIVRKNVSIADFHALGFPLVVVYKIEGRQKPVRSLNNMHVNNGYKIEGKNLYLIEAVFRRAQDIEDFEDIVRSESRCFRKHYIVDDIARERFIPK